MLSAEPPLQGVSSNVTPARPPISLTRRRLKPGCKPCRHRAGPAACPSGSPWKSQEPRGPDAWAAVRIARAHP